jgi:hypothetical protein
MTMMVDPTDHGGRRDTVRRLLDRTEQMPLGATPDP